jgi:hypothetical protein
MKLISTTAALAGMATAASAHADHLPHVHGTDAVFWGAVLVLVAGVVAYLRAR